jgi:flagellar motility protein MotE (MotC chaperone)
LVPQEETDPDLLLSKEELLAKIVALEADIENQRQSIDNIMSERDRLNLEIARLQQFESEQLEFRQEQEQFYSMIAENDPNAYVEFYEAIDPELRGPLYERAAMTVEEERIVKQYVSTFQTMDAGAVAEVLQQLTGNYMTLVVNIMEGLDSEQAADVLAEMEAANAASVARMMAPDSFLQ